MIPYILAYSELGMQIFGLENQCFWLQVARSQSYRILSFAPIDLPKTMPWFFGHLSCLKVCMIKIIIGWGICLTLVGIDKMILLTYLISFQKSIKQKLGAWRRQIEEKVAPLYEMKLDQNCPDL